MSSSAKVGRVAPRREGHGDATAERVTLTVKETASLLGLHAESVYALLACRQLRSVRVGRKYLIPKAEINRFLGVDGKHTSARRDSAVGS